MSYINRNPAARPTDRFRKTKPDTVHDLLGIRWFEGEGGAGSGGNDAPASGDKPDGGGEQAPPTPAAPPAPAGGEDRKFTQADIDKAIETRLAREKKKHDTTAQQIEKAEAAKKDAETARDKILADVAAALGVTKDDTPPDPASLQKTITESAGRISTLEQQNTELRIELDAWRAAVENELNPVALLDSRTFAAELAQLDRAQDGYRKALTDAVVKAGETNPALKATPTPRTPKPDPTQGSGRPAASGAERGIAEAQRRFGAKTSN